MKQAHPCQGLAWDGESQPAVSATMPTPHTWWSISWVVSLHECVYSRDRINKKLLHGLPVHLEAIYSLASESKLQIQVTSRCDPSLSPANWPPFSWLLPFLEQWSFSPQVSSEPVHILPTLWGLPEGSPAPRAFPWLSRLLWVPSFSVISSTSCPEQHFDMGLYKPWIRLLIHSFDKCLRSPYKVLCWMSGGKGMVPVFLKLTDYYRGNRH